MKRWTVMLIPHDRGSTRTLTLSAIHFSAVIVVVTVLSFIAAFFYQRHYAIARNVEELHQANRALELENARKPDVIQETGLRDEERHQIETQLRAEYDTSIAAISAESLPASKLIRQSKVFDVKCKIDFEPNGITSVINGLFSSIGIDSDRVIQLIFVFGICLSIIGNKHVVLNTSPTASSFIINNRVSKGL